MLDKNGFEIPDNTPVEVPTRLRGGTSRIEQIRRFVRFEMSQQAARQGEETFEEADDFSLAGGEEWFSPYEENFEPPIPAEPVAGGGPAVGGEAKPPGDRAEPGAGAPPPVKPVTPA